MRLRELCAFVAHYRPQSWNPKRAESLIERFKLSPEQRIKEMSKGQKAKAALLLALAFDPDLLILDEPTSGLDPVARREFVEGVLGEFQQSGRTVLMSSHLVNELGGLVDHVGIIHEGQLRLSKRTDELLDEMCEARLVFPDAAPQGIELEGLLRYRARGREAVVSIRNADNAALRKKLEDLGAEQIELNPLDLESAFVEFVGGLEKGTVS